MEKIESCEFNSSISNYFISIKNKIKKNIHFSQIKYPKFRWFVSKL